MIREATEMDIPALQVIRNAVKENRLSDPSLVKDEDYVEFLNNRGKGWVYLVQHKIAGFAIVDLSAHNVWALFIDPEFERMGIGRELHDKMLRWYFSRSAETLWLSTAPCTRAATFYRTAGWEEKGTYGKGEIRFEMRAENWIPVISG